MIHYIYRIDFLCGKPGRYYLGKHSFRYTNLDNCLYAGSGNFCKSYYKKYGKIKNVTYKKTILEENVDFETNRKREAEVIGDLWKTDPLCMNRCPGGGCVFAKTKSVVQYDLEGNVLNEFESVVEAERSTNAVKITGCCKGYNSTSGGFIWRFKDDSFDKYYVPKKIGEHKNKQKINQYNIDGKFIKTWESIADAAKEIGNTTTTGVIRKCLNHSKKCNTAYGYRWEFYNGNTDDIEPLQVKSIHPVDQYDLEGNFIARHRSCQAASIATGHKHVEGIMKCAEGLQESSYGYKWKYVND